MSDEDQIRAVLARYVRGVDRMDAETLRSVYWPDARDAHGAWEGARDDFVDYILERLKAWDAATHMLGQSLIAIDGETARVETYFQGHHFRNSPDGRRCDVVAGRYLDRFAKRNGEWRVADRVVVRDWTMVQSVNAALPAAGQQGSRGRDDPSWIMFSAD